IGSTTTTILDAHRPNKQAWQSNRGGCEKCVDEHDGEGHATRRNLRGRQNPKTDDSRDDSCRTARKQNLPELPNTCLTPEAPVHAEIVKGNETKGTSQENVGENDPRVPTNPREVLEANRECDDGRSN